MEIAGKNFGKLSKNPSFWTIREDFVKVCFGFLLIREEFGGNPSQDPPFLIIRESFRNVFFGIFTMREEFGTYF